MASFEGSASETGRDEDITRHIIMNGFVDVQVNGCLGIDLSVADLTLEDIRTVTRYHVSHGTAAFCPTVCTASMEVYRRNLPLLARAMREPDLAVHLLGIHLEGPFISTLPGARGAHQPEFIRKPSVSEFKELLEWSEGGVAMMTVAAGEPGIERLIEYAAGQGVLVSLGHHYASEEALSRAVRAGAKCCTHLGNGIPGQIDRHTNPLWWQLARDDLTGCFITDGHHLPASLIKVGLRAKGVDGFVVTSDASALAGMPAGEYQYFGMTVEIEPSGRIYSPTTQGLAGSHSTMIECMNYLASLGLLCENELWRVGRDNTLRLLGRSVDDIRDIPGPEVSFDGNAFVVGDRNE